MFPVEECKEKEHVLSLFPPKFQTKTHTDTHRHTHTQKKRKKSLRVFFSISLQILKKKNKKFPCEKWAVKSGMGQRGGEQPGCAKALERNSLQGDEALGKHWSLYLPRPASPVCPGSATPTGRGCPRSQRQPATKEGHLPRQISESRRNSGRPHPDSSLAGSRGHAPCGCTPRPGGHRQGPQRPTSSGSFHRLFARPCFY